MSKGKRKRANKEKVTPTNNEKSKQTVECNGKCNSNACECKSCACETKEAKNKTIYDMFPARALSQNDVNSFKELIDMSNNVDGLRQDYSKKEVIVKSMRESAKRIVKERKPMMIQIAQNAFVTETNYRQMSDNIKKQANDIEKAMKIVKGQIAHRYEDYISLVIRQIRIFESIVQRANINSLQSITGHRSKSKKSNKETEMLFQKDFDKIDEADKEILKKLNEKIKNAKKEAKPEK